MEGHVSTQQEANKNAHKVDRKEKPCYQDAAPDTEGQPREDSHFRRLLGSASEHNGKGYRCEQFNRAFPHELPQPGVSEVLRPKARVALKILTGLRDNRMP